MKILIVDDDKLSRDALEAMLKCQPGVEVMPAESAAQAWSLLEQEPIPDLCMLDIMMPDLDGLGFLKKIRDDPRTAHLQVVFCTAVKDRETVIRAAQLKPEGYLLKPYDRAKIIAEVNRAQMKQAEKRLTAVLETLREELAMEANVFRQLLARVAGLAQ